MGILHSSAAAEASAVVATTSARIDEVIATNSSGGVLYLQVFDASSLPADTTAPEVCVAIPATSTASWDPAGDKALFNTGIVVCLSSTAATKTIAGSVGVFTVRGSVD